MLRIKPQSISPEIIASLQDHLKILTAAIVASIDTIDKDLETYLPAQNELEKALQEVKKYGRLLRTAGHLQHVNVNATDFDDHDQVSSMLLYLVSKFEQQKTFARCPSKRILTSRVRSHWAQAVSSKAREFSNRFWTEPRIESFDIGILTVLEQEYQSVVRRLDSIIECTEEETSCGFGILDRMLSTDDMKDMKDTSDPLGSGAKKMGWTTGKLGNYNILVVCTGYAGKEKANECKKDAERLFSSIPKMWLVVGICAGSNDQWPIGTVLVSDESVLSMEASHSLRYKIKTKIQPISLQSLLPVHSPLPTHFKLQQLFRRAPDTVGHAVNIAIANPEEVKVYPVKFACTREVINVTPAKEAIRSHLTVEGHLTEGEDFGIEMEGPGVAAYSERTMCIIKGVCDYADEKKEEWKLTNAQVLFQLYAAETAADFAVQMIRKMPTST